MRPAIPTFARSLLLLLALSLVGAVPAAAVPPAVPAATLSPQDARTDREQLWSNGCLAFRTRTSPPTCRFGDRSSSFTLALVGDSHASHLFAGFERLAKQRGWRLDVYTKINCPFLDIPIRYISTPDEYTECAAWNANVLKALKKSANRPDLTVTVAWRGIRPMDGSKDTAAKEGAAIGRMLAQVPGRRAIIVDTPYSFDDVPDCLLDNPDKPKRCRIPSWEVLSVGVRTRERKAADVGNATYLDLTDAICGGFPCRVITSGVVMFRDQHHLTNTYAAMLRDPLGRALDRALD